jgi:hyperosmotically inducible protein
MKRVIATTLLIIGALAGPIVAVASDHASMDQSHPRSRPRAFVKDSTITTKIKARLAAEHIASLGRLHVETNKDGVVWLRGTVRTREAAKMAVGIARSTDGVRRVHSRIEIRKGD